MLMQDWLTRLGTSLQEMREYLPVILAAVALLAVGWIAARLLRSWTRRLIGASLDRFTRSSSVGAAMDQTGARTAVPNVIGGFVFWVVFLFFVAAAIETIGVPIITNSLNQLAYYLPDVFAAVVLVVAGVVAGHMARGAVVKAAGRAGVVRGEAVGRLVQTGVLLVAIVVGLEQVGISGRLLVALIAIVTGAVFAGAGLAFGLGARTAVSNIIASYYVTQTYQVGQRLRIGGVEGRIIQTTPAAVIVETPDGQVLIPAHKFVEETSVLVTAAG